MHVLWIYILYLLVVFDIDIISKTVISTQCSVIKVKEFQFFMDRKFVRTSYKSCWHLITQVFTVEEKIFHTHQYTIIFLTIQKIKFIHIFVGFMIGGDAGYWQCATGSDVPPAITAIHLWNMARQVNWIFFCS